MNKKNKIFSIAFVFIILTVAWLIDETTIQRNQYGLSEAKVFDWTFSLSHQYDDGPYIFLENNSLIEKTIIAGELKSKELPLSQYSLDYPFESSAYSNVSRIAAISDIHGQHAVLLKILESNQIINSRHQWAFGDGHLVIVGDIFDRGPQVLDSLWFIYHLENQARAAGGKVHYLLGNHEYMVLMNDLRYLHQNYQRTAELLETNYTELFSPQSVLGMWLRSKATVIKINQTLFTHGGLSSEFLSLQLDLNQVNQLFKEAIDLPEKTLDEDKLYSTLMGRNGPIWYRGYFRGEQISTQKLSDVLNYYSAQNIVVGHTSFSEISSTNQGKVFAVDSSIKKGQSGEILLIEGDDFYRGKFNGERALLYKN